MDNVVKGGDMMLFQKKGEKFTALGAATNHTLSLSATVFETSNKDGGKWGDSQPGRLSWNMTTENMLVLSDYETLVDAWIRRERLKVAFAVAENANNDEGKPAEGWLIDTGGYEGEVIITQVDVNTPSDDNATYTVTFQGVGPLIKRNAA